MLTLELVDSYAASMLSGMDYIMLRVRMTASNSVQVFNTALITVLIIALLTFPSQFLRFHNLALCHLASHLITKFYSIAITFNRC